MQSRISAAVEDKVRIIVIEEHELFRQGLCLLLSQHEDLSVVGDAGIWSEALSLVKREQPDVVVLAISAENIDCINLLPQLFEASDATRVLVLSESSDQELPRRAMRLGAAGVLFKNKSADMLVKAIECINAGEAWLDRSTTASLLRELSPRSRAVRRDPEEAKIASLSQREREVIQFVGKGLKNKQIAEALFISDITVHHHLTNIYAKLEVADRLELLIYAYRNGLAELPH
ncbi:MAG: response regulator transcription factor [Acidobacteria bacterium]|nr:response regulator transcription factor [Acidobacteriota bacterium]